MVQKQKENERRGMGKIGGKVELSYGRQKERGSFGEICSVGVLQVLKLATAVTGAAAALFSH